MMATGCVWSQSLVLGLIGVIWAGHSAASESLPPPRPELIQLANLIIHAEVEHVAPSKRKSDRMATIRFRALETLRGAAEVGSRVEISCLDVVMCPMPPKFQVGEKRVMLLTVPDAQGMRHLCWGRHAARSGSRIELDEIRQELRTTCPFLLESDPVKTQIAADRMVVGPSVGAQSLESKRPKSATSRRGASRTM